VGLYRENNEVGTLGGCLEDVSAGIREVVVLVGGDGKLDKSQLAWL
jgi:hypothetical protein